MIRFEKISYEQFKEDFLNNTSLIHKISLNSTDPDAEIKRIYNNIKLPARATHGSAGYDFFSPVSFTITKKFFESEELLIPTGIKFVTDRDDIVLLVFPRSGLGFKYGLALKNTCGVIDSDYQYAKNEGHIHAKIRIDARSLEIEEGAAFCQGVILPFLKCDDDEGSKKSKRKGGFGSTSK